jgi:hypothetical protein
MGSILIRQVPNNVHRKFKLACRARKVSMEETIVRLIAREVGEGVRGRPRKLGAKRKATAAKKTAKKAPKKGAKKTARKPAKRAGRRSAGARRG